MLSLVVPMIILGILALPQLVAAQDTPDRVAFDEDLIIKSGEVVEGNASVTNGDLTLYGEVRGNVVVVNGDAEINGTVEGDVTVTTGAVTLGPDSLINGNLLVVSGKLTHQEGYKVEGVVSVLPFPLSDANNSVMPVGPPADPAMDLHNEAAGPVSRFTRWLSLGMGSLVILLLTVAVAWVMPGRVRVASVTLESVPGPSIVVGMIAALVFMPVVAALSLVLVVTVIGTVLIPVLVGGVLLALLFGLVVISQWLGKRVYDTSRQGAAYEVPPTLVQVLLGMAVLLSSTLLPAAFLPSWVAFILGGLLYVAACVGLGATILCRFGTLAPPRPSRPHSVAHGHGHSITSPLGPAPNFSSETKRHED
ncbi:MAG TPA: polymer-forming cytoskeletal protein [Chloroflexia bacterium]|nr:polymer-forming cytoskeletal protein [Chloroflexia bacterium]